MIIWALLTLLDADGAETPPAPNALSILIRHRRKVKAAIAWRRV
jgi:hypothetical protein